MPTWLLIVIGVILAPIVLAAVCVVLLQDRIVYVRDIGEPMLLPEMYGFEEGVSYENVTINTRDGERLHGWFFKARMVVNGERAGNPLLQESVKLTPTIFWLHANAGTVCLRLPSIYNVVTFAKCNVFIIDYRGYGLSTGLPSEQGLKIDAEDSLKYLLSRSDIDPKKIVVFGRSLGGAVAVHLATNPETADKFGALVLENTFSTLADLAVKLLPAFRPLVPFLHSHWLSIEEIKKHSVKVPTMFFAAVHDEMIPHEQMCALYEAARQSLDENKRDMVRIRKFLRGGHMSLPESNLMYYSWLRDWLAEVFPEITAQLSSEALSQLQFQLNHPQPASDAETDHSEADSSDDDDGDDDSDDQKKEEVSALRERSVATSQQVDD